MLCFLDVRSTYAKLTVDDRRVVEKNMPGRMGDGEAYLANPFVVAASAVNGSICGPEDLST